MAEHVKVSFFNYNLLSDPSVHGQTPHGGIASCLENLYRAIYIDTARHKREHAPTPPFCRKLQAHWKPRSENIFPAYERNQGQAVHNLPVYSPAIDYLL